MIHAYSFSRNCVAMVEYDYEPSERAGYSGGIQTEPAIDAVVTITSIEVNGYELIDAFKDSVLNDIEEEIYKTIQYQNRWDDSDYDSW